MIIFRVIFERDGATTKEDGKTSTEIVRSEHRYAANEIETAWAHAVDYTKQVPDERIVAIVEEHPLLAVLPSPEAASSEGSAT
jgi:hypothetical protein